MMATSIVAAAAPRTGKINKNGLHGFERKRKFATKYFCYYTLHLS